MSASQKIKDYLEKERVGYQVLEHSAAYTAMEIAGSQHIPGREVIKPVIVKTEGQYIMCVLPAIHYLDMEKFKILLNAKEIRLANEEELNKLFPDFEVGAEPPFGNLYGLIVYADKMLEEVDDIVFNAGTHTDMIKIKFRDFLRLTNPILAEIGVHIHTVKG